MSTFRQIAASLAVFAAAGTATLVAPSLVGAPAGATTAPAVAPGTVRTLLLGSAQQEAPAAPVRIHSAPLHIPSPPQPSTPPPASGLKPLLAGLLDRLGPPRSPNGWQGFVIEVTWAQLQPTGPDSLDTTSIDQQLALAARDGLGVKLRILGGIHAPEWLKLATGPVVKVTDPTQDRTGTIGRYWTAAYGAAYDHLQALLAARYDQVAALRQVEITRCSTVYGETFIRDEADVASAQALSAAGLTASADETCIMQEIQAAQVWTTTRAGLALNPYQEIVGNGVFRTDETFTNQMMVYCRQQLGARCVLENNSLRNTPMPNYADMYQTMTGLGGPIDFQTACPAHLGSLLPTLALAASYGGDSVELPGGSVAGEVPTAQVTALLHNAARS